jgi:hypothetical protein
MSGCHEGGIRFGWNLECRLMWKVAVFLAAPFVFVVPAAAQQSPENPEIDWSRINVDALDLLRQMPQSGGAVLPLTQDDSAKWNWAENRNGSANVARTRSWANGISTNVGVDNAPSQQGWALPGAAPAPANGAGWARAAIPGVGLIDQATIDARVDPDSDQRKLGARFEKAIPLNQNFSVTLQNGFGVSQPLASQTVPGAPPPAQTFDSEQLAKFNLLNSGTSLFAGSKQSSAEDRRLNSFGAEQNLLGGISVSGAVNENTAGGHDRSLSARFRRTW